MELKEYIDKKLVHSIHTSGRKSFRSCRRRWHWTNVEMYYPRTTPAPLEFGVAFHAAMEKFYDPRTWTQDILVKQGLAMMQFKMACDEQIKNYRRMNGELDLAKQEEYENRLTLGLHMIRYYTENISRYTDVGFTPVEVEIPFEIAILSPTGEPIWCKCNHCWRKWCKWLDSNPEGPYQVDFEARESWRRDWQGLPVTYGGRLDMLAMDDLGRYWIYDWKTTSRILDEDAESSFLTLDDQVSSYIWALRSLGLNVVGFVYVEIRKAYPTTPKELSRLYKGRRYSTSKTEFATPEQYMKFVEDNDPLAYAQGLYDEHIGWLKSEGPKFHQRHQIHKNDKEVAMAGYNIWLEAQDMTQEPRIYPQPGRFSCNTCLFKQPCIGKNQGEDYQYTLDSMFDKQEFHYYELVDMAQEAKKRSTEKGSE